MLSGYQGLVHNSATALYEFRDNSKSAIGNVISAIEFFHEQEYTDAIEIMVENKVKL